MYHDDAQAEAEVESVAPSDSGITCTPERHPPVSQYEDAPSFRQWYLTAG